MTDHPARECARSTTSASRCPNIEEASAFLVAAFGAEVVFDMQPVGAARTRRLRRPDDQARLGVRPACPLALEPADAPRRGREHRALRVRGCGPAHAADGRDLGINALRASTSTTSTPRRRASSPRAAVRSRARSCCRGPESGDGNWWLYTVAPWGGIIELVSYPGTPGLRGDDGRPPLEAAARA